MSEGVCVNLLGSYYRQRSCRCPWSGLPAGTMLVSKGCADLPGPAPRCGTERAGPTPCRLPHSGEQRDSLVPCLGSTIELALVAGGCEPIPSEYRRAGPAVHLPGNGMGIGEMPFFFSTYGGWESWPWNHKSWPCSAPAGALGKAGLKLLLEQHNKTDPSG